MERTVFPAQLKPVLGDGSKCLTTNEVSRARISMMARSKVSKQRSDRLTQTVSSTQNIPLATHGRSIDLRVDSSSTDDSRLRGALPQADICGAAKAVYLASVNSCTAANLHSSP